MGGLLLTLAQLSVPVNLQMPLASQLGKQGFKQPCDRQQINLPSNLGMGWVGLGRFGFVSRSRADDIFPLLRFWKLLAENESDFSVVRLRISAGTPTECLEEH